MRSFLALGLSAVLTLGAYGCASPPSEAPASDAPADEQAEEEVTSGVTKFASKLQDPDSLTSLGDSIYFATTYGFATQEYAEYEHDIWVKTGSARAKRLYKGLHGASWAMAATKNGLYEINEAYASVMRYPIDGSKPEGEGIYHAIYGQEEMPQVGIRALVADDDGLVLGLRADDDETKAGNVVALSPAGKNEKKLGAVAGGATALTLAGGKVYVGTGAGKVYAVPRDGSAALNEIAKGEGVVSSIAVAGDDVFFATDKGLFAKRKGIAAPQKLLAERTGSLSVVNDRLYFGQYQKGVSSLPLAGGEPKLALKTGAPSSTLFANGFVWVTDRSYGRCRQTDEGQACAFDGAAFRLKL